MTTTSFPYLKIARDFGVPYGDVIRFVATISGVKQDDWRRPVWECRAMIAWVDENQRRLDIMREREKQT